MTLTITLNGEPRRVAAGATIASLLADLGLDASKVAVERNLAIAPRSAFGEIALGDGDALEIVHFVGGGEEQRQINAYGADQDMKLAELGEVRLEEALRLVDDRYSYASTRFVSGEEAWSKTMVGFSVTPREFVEIVVNGADQVSVRFEMPTGRTLFGLLPKSVEEEATFRNVTAIKSVVQAFFVGGGQAFVDAFDRLDRANKQ